MATKTSTEVKQDLDDLLLEDTVDAEPWTAVRKRRAINRAVRASWPHFKVAVENTTAVTLASGTYAYSLSAVTNIEDIGNGVGIVQVLVEPDSSDLDYLPLRRVQQARDGTTWRLYVPEGTVEAYDTKKLKLRYYRRLVEFSAWDGTETIPAEFANYVVYAAAAELFGLYAQGGSDFNVEDMLKLIPRYEQRAAEELKKNTVYCMPVLVGVRSEATY